MKLSLPDYQESNVMIVGDLMLDRYWHGPTGRISPEAPVPVVRINHHEERAGGAANVAMNIAALGGRARLLGLVGEDEPARILNEKLSAVKIDCDFVTQKGLPTITKLRVMSRNQQLIRLDFEEPFHDVDPKPLLDLMAQYLSSVKVVIFSDYGKGALEKIEPMIELAKSAGVMTLVDPKGTDFERYRGVTLLTPNMSEFEAVVGPCKDNATIVSKALTLIERLDLQGMLITRSEHGMTLVRPNEPPVHLPTQAKEVYDVTGAGDTVISVLGASLAAGKSFEDACSLANAAAGVVVGKLGTSTLSTIELTEAVYGSRQSGFGVTDKENLLEAVKVAKAKGDRIVMTNGCFDILHAGHVAYLNEAAKLGDRLIVAVNTDASVKKLKGEGRPVNPVDRRMAVLAGLGAVDWVVPFAEETPEQLISQVLPHVLVKGGDYQVDQIAGGQQVIAAGGEVRVLNFEDGCSTSEIIDSILNNHEK